MKRLYLVDTQVKELNDCIRNRICMLSMEMMAAKKLEDKDKLCDRINILTDISDLLEDDGNNVELTSVRYRDLLGHVYGFSNMPDIFGDNDNNDKA